MGKRKKDGKIISIEIETDNTDKVLGELDEAIDRALEAMGMKVEDYAKAKCPVDTGLLRNSITHALGGKPTAITSYQSEDTHATTAATQKAGTAGKSVDPVRSGSYSGNAPSEKAVFIGSNVEYAAYVECGKDGGKTNAQPYLKPAVMDHVDELKNLAKDALAGF